MVKKVDAKSILKATEDAAPIIQLAGTLVAVVASAVTVAQPAFDKMAEKSKEYSEKQSRLIKVPETCFKDYPKTLEQAIINIEEVGLKAEASPVLVREAHIRYKDCFANQVVNSHPKQNKKVEPQSRVCLKYVTQDVIDASNLLFQEREEKKLSDKIAKENKRAEQRNNNKMMINNTLQKISKRKSTDLIEEKGENDE